MPHGPNPESDERKIRLVLDLQCRFGELERKYSNRHDWYSVPGGKIELFITDSTAHFDKRPWFDMKKSDIAELAEHQAGFIIFILGEAENYLVVPAKKLKEAIRTYIAGRRKLKKGFYHFNLLFPGKTFTQLPDFELHPYLNNLRSIEIALEQ
jgi:hypothetical protein